MAKLSLKKAEEPYGEAIDLLEERLENALAERNILAYLENIDVEVYIRLMDSYLDILYHYFSDFSEQPKEVKSFFKGYLKVKEKENELLESINALFSHLRVNCAQFAALQWKLLEKSVKQMIEQKVDDLHYAITVDVPLHVFYPAHAGYNFSFVVSLMATCRAGFLWFLLKNVPEFKAEYPFLQYIPDDQSSHRCSTHEKLFYKTFSVDNPIWNEILPANGEGCKCKIQVVRAVEVKKADPFDSFVPDKERNEFKAFYPFNCIEDKTLFYWMKSRSMDGSVLEYSKEYSKEREPLSFRF